MAGSIKITLVRSIISRPRKQRRVVESLGIRKLNHSVIKEDSPSIRGMVQTINHLLKVEELA